jgi:predicted dehydrogenase
MLANLAQVYRKAPNLPPPDKLMKDIDTSKIKDYQALMKEKFLDIKTPEIKKADQLEAELSSFIDCIQTGKRPVVSGEDGLAALTIAEEIIKQVS